MQLSNFLELERDDTLENVERVQNAISTQQGYLDYINQDWACWDDTYRFIEDRNQKFIDVNLNNQTLAGIKVNVVLFVNESGSVVYAKSVDINTAKEVPVPEDLLRLVENGTLLTKSENDTKSGFVLLEENPMFISCHQILTTEYEGPMKGTLIFGRYFDDTLLNSFKESTQSSLSMSRLDEYLPPDFQTKLDKFPESPNGTIVEPLNEERVAGYFELPDISGKPALIIRADFPRTLYSQSKESLTYTTLLFEFISLLIIVISLFLYYRVSHLNAKTRTIEKGARDLRSELINLVDKSANIDSNEGFYDLKYLIRKRDEEFNSLSQKIKELENENYELFRQLQLEKSKHTINNDSNFYEFIGSKGTSSEEIGDTLVAERIAIYRQIFSEFSHSIKTPLSAVGIAVKAISEKIEILNECDEAERHEIILNFKMLLENALVSLETIKKILNGCGGFSPTNSQRLLLSSIIPKIVRISKDSTKSKCKVFISVDEVPEFKSNWLNVFLPIMQVVENAFEAVNENGNVSIKGTFHNGIIELLISDDGTPIPEEIKEKIFDNGFSSKGEKRGLGLQIAAKCLESIGGEISLVNSNKDETTFCIKFKPEIVYE